MYPPQTSRCCCGSAKQGFRSKTSGYGYRSKAPQASRHCEPRVKGEVVDLNRGDAFRIVPFLTTIPCCHHHLEISKGSAVASHGPNELFEGESQRSTLQLSSRRRLHQQRRSRRAWRLQCEWNWSAQHKSCAVNSSWDPIPKIHSCWILRFGCPLYIHQPISGTLMDATSGFLIYMKRHKLVSTLNIYKWLECVIKFRILHDMQCNVYVCLKTVRKNLFLNHWWFRWVLLYCSLAYFIN